MTMQEHVNKVHLILDNTESLYKRKIAIFKVYDKTKDFGKLKNQVTELANAGVNATNLSETADPFMSGILYLRVAGLVYVDLLTEYQEGEWK